MEFSFSTKVHAKKEDIWKYYSDIQMWYLWESDLKNITLEGGFNTGSEGVMELEDMPPMKYVLTYVKEMQEFWDKTETPFGSIYFGHEILSNDDSTFNVKHTVKLVSDSINEEKLEFLKNVFSDVPNAVTLLKKKVEESE